MSKIKRDALVAAESKLNLARSLVAEARSAAGEYLSGDMRGHVSQSQFILEEWDGYLRRVLDKDLQNA